jgi:hypothetical protein
MLNVCALYYITHLGSVDQKYQYWLA